MFDNLLGNAEEFEKQMQDSLMKIKVNEENDALNIEALANGSIQNVRIKEEYLSVERKEELEDFLALGFTSLYKKIQEQAALQSSQFLKDMMPGMENFLK